MENKASRPAEYLKDGFLDESGNLRSGINGEFSLGIAYQLRADGVTSDDVQEYRDRIEEALETHVPAGEELAVEEPVDRGARTAIQEVARELRGRCELVGEILEAGESVLTNWKSLACLMEHIERIHAQVAIIQAHTESE